MKTIHHALLAALLLSCAAVFTGCSTFTVQQEDVSTAHPDGTETRTITSHTKARTFFDAKSGLANFKTTQTDKTQSSSVGALNQEASGTNAVNIAASVAEAAVRAALKP